MLSQQSLPQSPRCRQPTGSLDGEQVFADRPLLLA
jgi:hypothetical protein